MGLFGSIFNAALDVASIPLNIGAKVVDTVADIDLEEDVDDLIEKLKLGD